MALLQIAEPGQSTAPHQHKLAAGIDLGTTHSLVATVQSGQPRCLPDEANRYLLPSVVHYYPQTGHQVGYPDNLPAAVDSISSVKRLLGKHRQDIAADSLPYRLTTTASGTVAIATQQGPKTPVQVSADILRSLGERAEHSLGGPLAGVVITVPAYFDDAQRQSTKEAAKLAGLPVLRLLNEPTAAAIAYGLESQQEGLIAVYDLGGGTFDISLLQLHQGVFEVQATAGNSALGGDDIDHALLDWLQAQAGREQLSLAERQLGLPLARQLKEQLSTATACECTFLNWHGEVTRATLDALTLPLIKRTLKTCRTALRDAKANLADLRAVVLVGGATRMPLVRAEVEAFFQQAPLTSVDPDQVVAIGAAIQANALVGNQTDQTVLLLDVLPLSLGLETMGGLVEKVIPRNTPIPVALAQEFTTYQDGQTSMMIHVLQGEREQVAHCRSLAQFTLTGIPPMTAGAAHIRVTFQVDADGLLSVTAQEKTSGVCANVEVKPAFGLDETQILDMLTSSQQHAQADMAARMLAEQRVDADRLLLSLTQAIAQDGDLLTAAERQHLDEAMATLTELKHNDNPAAIEQAIAALDKASQTFAAARMDKAIKLALAGQSIHTL